MDLYSSSGKGNFKWRNSNLSLPQSYNYHIEDDGYGDTYNFGISLNSFVRNPNNEDILYLLYKTGLVKGDSWDNRYLFDIQRYTISTHTSTSFVVYSPDSYRVIDFHTQDTWGSWKNDKNFLVGYNASNNNIYILVGYSGSNVRINTSTGTFTNISIDIEYSYIYYSLISNPNVSRIYLSGFSQSSYTWKTASSDMYRYQTSSNTVSLYISYENFPDGGYYRGNSSYLPNEYICTGLISSVNTNYMFLSYRYRYFYLLNLSTSTFTLLKDFGSSLGVRYGIFEKDEYIYFLHPSNGDCWRCNVNNLELEPYTIVNDQQLSRSIDLNYRPSIYTWQTETALYNSTATGTMVDFEPLRLYMVPKVDFQLNNFLGNDKKVNIPATYNLSVAAMGAISGTQYPANTDFTYPTTEDIVVSEISQLNGTIKLTSTSSIS